MSQFIFARNIIPWRQAGVFLKKFVTSVFIFLNLLILNLVNNGISQNVFSPYLQESTIIDDFQVHPNTGGAVQERPRVVLAKNGSYNVVWTDYRHGNADIFLQHFNAENKPVGENIRVNDDMSFKAQTTAIISGSENGRFIVAWRDWRNGVGEIYFQLFDEKGQRIGSNSSVPDDTSSVNYVPCLEMVNTNEFILVWLNGTDYYLQRFNMAGQPVAERRLLTQISGNDFLLFGNHVALAMAEDGFFVVVWLQSSQSSLSLHAQRFSADGAISGNPIIVEDNLNRFEFYHPKVLVTPKHQFVVSWRNHLLNTFILARFYNENGNPITDPIQLIKIDWIWWSQEGHCTFALNEKEFAIVYADYRNHKTTLWRQDFNFKGESITEVHTFIDSSLHVPGIEDFQVSEQQNDSVVVVWSAEVEAETAPDIYSEIVVINKTSWSETVRVSQDEGYSTQKNPRIAPLINDEFFVIWDNQCGQINDLLFKKFSATGISQGDAVELFTRWSGTFNLSSGLANDYLVVSGRSKYSSQHGLGRMITSNGQLNQPEFTINLAGSEKYSISNTSIGVLDDRHHALAWEENDSGSEPAIYTGILNLTNNSVSKKVRVSDFLDDYENTHPKIIADPHGEFFMVYWIDSRFENSYIFAQTFTKGMIPVGINFPVCPAQNSVTGTIFTNGTVLFIWQTVIEKDSILTGQILDLYGTPVSESFFIDHSPQTHIQKCPVVASRPDDHFVVAWVDDRNGHPDIFTRKFDPGCQPLGNSIKINNDTEFADQTNPSISLADAQVYFAWEDRRDLHHGGCVYAKVINWNWDEPGFQKPAVDGEIELIKNHPNPFNAWTQIQFSIPSSQHVELSIFDILGRQVMTLVNENKSAGKYVVNWEATNNDGTMLASGVYFCMLRTHELSKTRKLILIR